MITLITLVKNRHQLDNLKRNLVSLEPTFNLGLDILCLVNDDNLYLEVRDYLLSVVNRGECRIEYVEDNVKGAKDFITDKNPYIFISDCDYILPIGGINTLYQNYLEKPRAGFISGVDSDFNNDFYWLAKGIYGPISLTNKLPTGLKDGLQTIDTITPRALLTRTNLFKEIFCSEDIDDASDYSFGIKLRRQGYQNYLNTKVKLRQEIE